VGADNAIHRRAKPDFDVNRLMRRTAPRSLGHSAGLVTCWPSTASCSGERPLRLRALGVGVFLSVESVGLFLCWWVTDKTRSGAN